MQDKLLNAALAHVPFDGWSQSTFDAAAADAGVDSAAARSLFPRGPVDMAIAFHRRGDEQMRALIAETDLSALRYSEKVARAVRLRIEVIDDKEIVRRGMALFALPQNAADGAALIWGTADAIWNALGDTSRDANWYSKRAILSGVYASTVLYWLGDSSEGNSATWDFLNSRIGNVMQFEKLKAQVRENQALRPLVSLADSILGNIHAPSENPRSDLPGRWPPQRKTP